ncbi:643_t:CDS:2, partial [Funneliformis geosporum]
NNHQVFFGTYQTIIKKQHENTQAQRKRRAIQKGVKYIYQNLDTLKSISSLCRRPLFLPSLQAILQATHIIAHTQKHE